MSYLWSCFVAGCSGTERHFISRIFLWKSMHSTNTKITNQFNCEKVSISMWVHLGQISAVIWQPLWNHMLSIYKVRQYVWPPADFYGDQLHFCCYLFLQFFFLSFLHTITTERICACLTNASNFCCFCLVVCKYIYIFLLSFCCFEQFIRFLSECLFISSSVLLLG